MSDNQEVRKSKAISITTSRIDQSKAAGALSEALSELGCEHAFIGGFAWGLLGSDRPTQINVLVEIKDKNIQVIRSKLSEVSRQIAKAGLKLYYVKELKDDLTGDELVLANKNNVLIETLQAGSLGLPQEAGPIYLIGNEIAGTSLKILHPGVLLLTKMKRWYINRGSTYPKTVIKTASDRRDLEFLVYWLVEKDMTIEFEMYKGKTRKDLLIYVKGFKAICEEDEELMDALQKSMKEDDWTALLALEPEETQAQAQVEPQPEADNTEGVSPPEAD